MNRCALQVPPIEYFKHVILELQSETDASHKAKQQSNTKPLSPTSTPSKTPSTTKSIHDLQKRFEEVSKPIASRLCKWNCECLFQFQQTQTKQTQKKIEHIFIGAEQQTKYMRR